MTGSTHDEFWAARLAAVLREAPSNSGMYEETVAQPSATTTFTFSLATGLGSRSAAREYENILGRLPTWLQQCHPYHRARLCRMAVAAGRCLPLTMPEATPAADTSHSL